MVLKGSLRFRSAEKTGAIHAGYSEEGKSTPCHVTLRNWVQKVGYYELTRIKEQDDWIIMADHSIQFGPEKILVVLGIKEHDFKKLSGPLNYEDLSPLLIKSARKWNGDSVSSEIEKLKTEIGNITYATADHGSDLRKGLKLSKIVHIHDLSHMVALVLKKLYAEDKRYQSLKTRMAKMRTLYIQTNIAEVVPPAGRSKSEYQNFERIISWSNKALYLVNHKLTDETELKKLEDNFDCETLERMRKELVWLNEYSGLIEELTEINRAVKTIEKELKHNGLSSGTLERSKRELEKLTSDNGKQFASTLQPKLSEQKALLPENEKILFSSDILESIFGRYKNRVSENPMASVTGLMLIIAAFTAKITPEYVKKVMESVKTNNVKEWEKNQVGPTLFKRRCILFSGE